MGFPSTWLRSLKKKFNKPPGRDPADQIPSVPRLSTVALVQDDEEDDEECAEVEQPHHINILSLSAEDWAAIKIQAYFRGHLVCSPTHAFYVDMDTTPLRVDYNVPVRFAITGQTGISSFEEPGEAAGIGPWNVCEKTGEDSSAVHGGDCPPSGPDSCQAAPWGCVVTTNAVETS